MTTPVVLFTLSIGVIFGVSSWLYYRSSRTPSRQELVLMKKWLEYSVTFWRYPEGGYVPQHKRLRLMRELRRVCRQLD